MISDDMPNEDELEGALLLEEAQGVAFLEGDYLDPVDTTYPSIDERLMDMETALGNMATLIHHLGQTLSWSSCGQRLNHPPEPIKRAQREISAWHKKVQELRNR